jgi:hypothetical protein
MTTTTEKQPTRFLGEGSVGKCFKRYMFVDDTRFGRVYIPLDAAWPKAPDCTDLRNIFSTNDNVVFTAIRQAQKQHECSYIACSVIHKNDLQNVSGKMTEKCNQYAYCESSKLGKIFVPFSARGELGRPWHGKNAEIGTMVAMKVLPQPEFQKCAYVAFAAIPFSSAKEEINNLSSTRADRQPENITQQLGIIVVEPTDTSDGLIYAQTTGSISFSKNTVVNGKCEPGIFVYFDATKSLSGQQHEKCSWKANLVNVIGQLPCVETDMSPNRFSTTLDNCLTVTVTAIVCRVSHSNSSAWLWNDLLGRIFVNNHHYVLGLGAFDVVTVKSQFTAAFEDVPWSAISVRIIHENEEQLREEYGQLMLTADNWKVLHVSSLPTGGFYGFMENPLKEAAFMAWTDLNVGEIPPKKDSLCRVTSYKQHRDKRHPWRALLVTPLDEETLEPLHNHPMYSTIGQFHPSVQSQIKIQKPPQRQLSQPQGLPSPSTNGNVWTVPSATATTTINSNSNSKLPPNQTSSSNTSVESGIDTGFSIVSEPPPVLPSSAIQPPPGFTSSLFNLPIGAERALNLNLQQNGDTSRTQSVDSFVISDLSDSIPKNNDLLLENNKNNNNFYSFDPWGGFGSSTLNPWQPLGATPLSDNSNKITSNSFGSSTLNSFNTMTSSKFNDDLLTPSNILSNSNFSSAIGSSLPKSHVIDDDGSSDYEKFLCDEISKRPHLLPKLLKKLISSNNSDISKLISDITGISNGSTKI